MKKAVKMMCAAMLCGLMFVACSGGSGVGGGKDYTGTYETTIAGMRIGMTLHADGTATAIKDNEEAPGFFWEANEKDGKVVITYGKKGDDGKFSTRGSFGYLYEDGKLTYGSYTYTKKQ